jgi:hypothetical protein
MSKEKSLPESALPPIPSESPAGWKKLREALDKSDWSKAGAELESMGLSKKLVPMLSVALIEERELGEIETAGEGKGELFTKLSTKLRYLISVIPKNANDVEKTSDKISQLKTDCNSALVARDAARRAQKMRKHLKNWIPQLWGLEAITSEHSGHLSGGILPPKTAKVASEVKGQRPINLYAVNSWRFVDKEISEFPRRKYFTNFTPVQPVIPIH